MKTVLIPTDLSIESLELIKNAVLNYPDQKINIVLACGKKTMISDFEPMNFLGLRNIELPINKEFINHKNKLHLEHKNQISKIKMEVFTGTNKYAFNNFLVANGITEALSPKKPLKNFISNNYFCLSQLIISNVENLVMIDNPIEESAKKEFNFKVTSILERVNL